MKTSGKENIVIFSGAGYLAGSVITILTAIVVFVVSENIVVSISSSIPLGMTIGMLLEQKFQRQKRLKDPRVKAWMLGLLLAGIIAFISVLLLVK